MRGLGLVDVHLAGGYAAVKAVQHAALLEQGQHVLRDVAEIVHAVAMVLQAAHQLLLRRGEEARHHRDVPAAALLVFIPDPSQQQALVTVCRQSAQQIPFIHGSPPDSACGTAGRKLRSPPAAGHGCPARQCGRPAPPEYGGQSGWWRAGAQQ